MVPCFFDTAYNNGIDVHALLFTLANKATR